MGRQKSQLHHMREVERVLLGKREDAARELKELRRSNTKTRPQRRRWVGEGGGKDGEGGGREGEGRRGKEREVGDIIEKHGNVTVKVKSRSQNNSHIKGFIKIHGEFMN